MSSFFDSPIETRKIVDARIAYRRFGRAGVDPPLLFLHGWPLAGVTFRELIPHLADRFDCIVPDLPGGGNTKCYEHTDYSWPGQATSVKRFVDELELDSYFLLGQDSGAMIARTLALIDRKRVLKLAMTNTEIPRHRPPWRPWYHRLARIPRLARLVFALSLRSERFLRSGAGFGGSFSDRELITGDFREYLIRPLVESEQKMLGQVRFLDGWDFDLLDYFDRLHAGIDMPTLLIWGEDDPTFPVEEAEKMAIQFPHSEEVKRIPGAGLFVQEEKPLEVSRALVAFFLGGRSAAGRMAVA